MSIKIAQTDHPILPLIAERWSPYVFSDRAVSRTDLQSLFEAARWAPSSYNEQPWRYLIATQDDPAEFKRLLACLVEGNQAWAERAPALALGVIHLRFARNNKENRAAPHDLGLATANLTLQATVRGLCVHQMIGILPDEARKQFSIPDEFEAFTALAIGYPAEAGSTASDPSLAARDQTPRARRRISEFVFTGEWGKPAPFAEPA